MRNVVLKLLQAEFPPLAGLVAEPVGSHRSASGFVSIAFISIYIAVRMVQGAKAELAAKSGEAAG